MCVSQNAKKNAINIENIQNTLSQFHFGYVQLVAHASYVFGLFLLISLCYKVDPIDSIDIAYEREISEPASANRT